MKGDNPGDTVPVFKKERQVHAAPIQNDYYDILSEKDICTVYGCAITIEDANETLQVRVTIDEEASNPANVAINHSTTYYLLGTLNSITGTWVYSLATTTALYQYPSFLFRGKKVRIEARKTTNLGAGDLASIVLYGEG